MILTDERVIPKLMKPTNGMLKEHIFRYEFAAKFTKGRVLDIACGVGYGTDILLNSANGESIKEIIGVDQEQEAISYAKEHYSYKQASYFAMDALTADIERKLGTFDTIISFETIEHLEEDERFINNLIKLLKPHGKLIISTPFGRGRGIPCVNPYHIHQYREEEFLELLSDFKQVDMYHQSEQAIEIPIKGKKYYLMVAVCCNI